jgi:hypothetical protein
VLWFGKGRIRKKHKRTRYQPHDTGWGRGLSPGGTAKEQQQVLRLR